MTTSLKWHHIVLKAEECVHGLPGTNAQLSLQDSGGEKGDWGVCILGEMGKEINTK